MKKQIQLLAVLLVVSISPAVGQYKNNTFKKTIDNKSQQQKVIKWSNWIPDANYPQLQVKYENYITASKFNIEIQNTGSTTVEAEFTANRCGDQTRNDWQWVVIEPGTSVKLAFAEWGGCEGNFYWWSQHVFIWSEWEQMQPDNYISYRWLVKNSEVYIDLMNNQDSSLPTFFNFQSNICEHPNYKAKWRHVNLWPGRRTQLRAQKPFQGLTDGTGCPNGFYLYYQKLKREFSAPYRWAVDEVKE